MRTDISLDFHDPAVIAVDPAVDGYRFQINDRGTRLTFWLSEEDASQLGRRIAAGRHPAGKVVPIRTPDGAA